MDPYVLVFGWIIMMFIIYPFKVTISWMIRKTKKNEKLVAWLTFSVMAIGYLVYISFISKSDIEVVLNGLTSMIPVLIFYLLYDLYKKPKLVSFLRHIGTRIAIAVISIIAIFPFYNPIVKDPLFITQTVIYIIYIFFFVWKRKRKENEVRPSDVQINL